MIYSFIGDVNELVLFASIYSKYNKNGQAHAIIV